MNKVILVVGIISVILQSCGNFGSFHHQKYTKLKIKKCNTDDSKNTLLQNDQRLFIKEVKTDSLISKTCEQEILPLSSDAKKQTIISEGRFEKVKGISLDSSKYDFKKMIINKKVSGKKHQKQKRGKANGWILYILGCVLLLIGVAAPLVAALIGWWIILTGIAVFFFRCYFDVSRRKKKFYRR